MPQPIDPTTEINRAAAVERLQQLTARADLNARAHEAHELAKQQLDVETNVDKPEAKSDGVERDLKRRNPYAGRRRKRPQDAPADEEARTFYTAAEKPTIAEDDEPQRLDISI